MTAKRESSVTTQAKNSLFLTTCVAVSLFIAGPSFAAGNGGTPNGKPFVAIQGEIAEIQGAVSTIEEQVALLLGQVNSLTERVSASEVAIVDLRAENVFLEALILGAFTSIEDINLEIDSLSNDVETNAGLITTLQAAIVSIEAGQLDLGNNLQDQIDNNLDLISALQGYIVSINEFLEMDQHITEGTCPEGLFVVGHTENELACAPVEGTGGTSITGYFRFQRSASFGRNIQVYCNPGDIATGGGFNAIQLNDSVRRSTPTGLNGWTVEGVGNQRDIQGYVMCLHVAP